MAALPITVTICDDDPLARHSMAAYLATAPDITVTSLHSDPHAALEAVADQHPDVLVTDIRMPQMDGIQLSEHLTTSNSRTRVLLITSFEDANVHQALRAGAAGYVLKSVTPNGLIDAVRAVHRGLTVVSAGPMAELVPHRPAGDPTPTLSSDETAALLLLCKGLSNDQIARTLHVSESTAKRHITSLMRKLNTTSRLTTVLEAQRLGLDH